MTTKDGRPTSRTADKRGRTAPRSKKIAKALSAAISADLQGVPFIPVPPGYEQAAVGQQTAGPEHATFGGHAIAQSRAELIDKLVDALTDVPTDDLMAGIAFLSRDLAQRNELSGYLRSVGLPDRTAELKVLNAIKPILVEEVYSLSGIRAGRFATVEDSDAVLKKENSDEYSAALPTVPRDLGTSYALGGTSAESLVELLRKKANPISKRTGSRIFRRLSVGLKKSICGPNGPYEAFQKNPLLGQKELPKRIVDSIVKSYGAALPVVLIPLCTYLAVIVIQTGLQAYCEADP